MKTLEIVTVFTEQGNYSSVLAMQVEKRRFHIGTFLTERDTYSSVSETESVWVDRCASSQTGALPSITGDS